MYWKKAKTKYSKQKKALGAQWSYRVNNFL